MQYVKKLREGEGAEGYEHLQVDDEAKQGYLDSGWEEATLEEWEAQMAEAEAQAMADDVNSTEEEVAEAPLEEV